MKFLVLGSGGREHAIAWKLSTEEGCEKVYVSPGNGGTSMENKCENIDFVSTEEMVAFCKREEIDITVVGPEQPLVEGIVDIFMREGLTIIGPHKKAAELEGSKSFAKDFMKKYGVRTAGYRVFDHYEKALEYLHEVSYPVVIKADGLAAGKGVAICGSMESAASAVKDSMVKDAFKDAGKTIVVEDFLQGFEASIVTLFDGEKIVPMVSCKDHKKIFDGEVGLNTGGMGVVAPNPLFTQKLMEDFKENIMKPTLDGLVSEGLKFRGFIFFGVMVMNGKNHLLEYNVRMGDPETQAIMSLMESSFSTHLKRCACGEMQEDEFLWKDESCCGVVAASGGYPKKYESDHLISDLGIGDNCKVFYAGVKEKDGELRTSGGRVACITSTGMNLEEARERAYSNMKNFSFKDCYYRSDIGKQ